ncbi:hypothetical protein [Microbulbifer sp. M83]|uniref:hypothetical protein n=1 Tax=Microbulbifer sp. M83 TaxID=3118246 RepID=UPI002FDF7056
MNTIRLQDKVVVEAMREAGDGWERITINYEVKSLDGEIVQSNAFFCHYSGEKELVFNAPDVDEALKTLSLSMSGSGKEISWQVADLVVDSTGKYKFDFSYEEPPRIMRMLGL